MEIAVSFNLECAHKAPITGKMHGHSYVATVWFTPVHLDSDIDLHAASIKTLGKMVDHTQLEESVGGSRMEDIATWLMTHTCLLPAIEITRVNVSRPTLGYQVEFLRPRPKSRRR